MHNHIYGIYIILFLLIILTSHAEEITLEQLQGEWLNKLYIETLQLTKSPRKAVNGIHYTSIQIFKENDSYRLIEVYEFHTGYPCKIVSLLPTSKPSSYQILCEVIYTRQVSNPDTFITSFVIQPGKSVKEIDWNCIKYGISDSNELHIPFQYVEPNINEYVNRIVLAGNYTDKQGQTFVFSESCEAQWPDKSFRYTVGLDYIYPKCDYFYITDKRDENKRKIPYAFSWESGKLYIFDTHFNEANPDIIEQGKEPLYVLTPR